MRTRHLSLILFFISNGLLVLSYGQKASICEDFNNNTVEGSWASNPTCNLETILDNWQTRSARLMYTNIESQEGNSDVFLKVRDVGNSQCGSWVYNSIDFTGDWGTSNECLCYDFRFFSSGGYNAPPTVLQVYAGAENPFSAPLRAEFVLYTPITVEEGWVHICPPLSLSENNGDLPSNQLGYWRILSPQNGNFEDWDELITNVSGIALKVDIGTGTEMYGIDNICFASCPKPPSPVYCCPGENLVRNGNFEEGDTDFSSEFTYNAQIDQGATLPGMYNVVSGTEAAIISPSWASVADPSYCSATQGKFMVVNGENGGVPEGEGNIPVKQIIWEQDFTVDEWASYKFCFEAKNLNQLGFNVVPAIEVVFSNNSIGNIEQTIYAGSGPCEWYSIERNIDLWGTGTNLTIQIVLDQERLGDGNDLAIDNIALIEIEKCLPTSVYFDLATQSNGDSYLVNANSATTDECEAIFWEICVVNPQSPTQDCLPSTKLTNPSAWWFEDINFPGYISSETLGDTALPGKFEYGKLYRITRGTWGACRGWSQFTRYVGAPRLTRRIPIYTEDEYMFNRERIIKDFSKTIGIKRN